MKKYKIVYMVNGEEKIVHIKAYLKRDARFVFELGYIHDRIIGIEEVNE